MKNSSTRNNQREMLIVKSWSDATGTMFRMRLCSKPPNSRIDFEVVRNGSQTTWKTYKAGNGFLLLDWSKS
ncbi:hypothetical protein Tcan_17912 [Toxocara canis]|uniref:Uncharacterized protein n=1 Tax=Toxocara canis TaxID=6265 RepID=A0A0B2W118_TOXCA|nr:hypothetical protein Tcan_17912 [Toxocara canis]